MTCGPDNDDEILCLRVPEESLTWGTTLLSYDLILFGDEGGVGWSHVKGPRERLLATGRLEVKGLK